MGKTLSPGRFLVGADSEALAEDQRLAYVAHPPFVERDRDWTLDGGVELDERGASTPPPVFGGDEQLTTDAATPVPRAHHQRVDGQPTPGQVAQELPLGAFERLLRATRTRIRQSARPAQPHA